MEVAMPTKIRPPRGLTSLVSGNLRCELVDVDPETATGWLSSRRKNRNINAAHVAFLAEQMERGEFVVSGETVVFNDKGEVMDGQHRLSAVVKSGKIITMLVVWGVPDSYFEVLGQGKSRNATDALAIGDHKNAALLASVARLSLRYTDTGFVTKFVRPSIGQITKVIEQNPGMISSCHFIAGAREVRSLMPPSAGAFAHWKLAQVSSEDEATQFMLKIATPSGMESTDPRFALNRMLTNLKMRGNAFGSHPEQPVALVFKTWNLWLGGRKVNLMTIKDGEEFPTPVAC